MKKENVYYDGTKLLSMKDINGNTPEIYICDGNRTAGKSVFFKRLLVNNWLNKRLQFVFLFRFAYEIVNVSEMFFSDIGDLFFEGHTMTDEPVAKGLFTKILLDGEVCGFAVPLSRADSIKKYSAFFNHVYNIFFDEFQSETNHYAPKELTKFQSVHVTIARGEGKQYRHTRTFMVSNSVSLINPYYVKFGIHKRLTKDTKFLRGEGWVLEKTFNKTAANALTSSGFFQAFKDSGYADYAAQNIYLNDNEAFVEKMNGERLYMMTLRVENNKYGIWKYPSQNLMYCCHTIGYSYYPDVVVRAEDHSEESMVFLKNSMLLRSLRDIFNNGQFRFEDLECKNAVFDALAL